MKMESLMRSSYLLEKLLDLTRAYPELLSRSFKDSILVERAKIEVKISKKLKEGRDE